MSRRQISISLWWWPFSWYIFSFNNFIKVHIRKHCGHRRLTFSFWHFSIWNRGFILWYSRLNPNHVVCWAIKIAKVVCVKLAFSSCWITCKSFKFPLVLSLWASQMNIESKTRIDFYFWSGLETTRLWCYFMHIDSTSTLDVLILRWWSPALPRWHITRGPIALRRWWLALDLQQIIDSLSMTFTFFPLHLKLLPRRPKRIHRMFRLIHLLRLASWRMRSLLGLRRQHAFSSYITRFSYKSKALTIQFQH